MSRPLFHLPSPTWLFLIAGASLLSATVIIPAQANLREVQWHRDRALASEAIEKERLFRHQRYRSAVEARDPTVMRSLMITQLRLVPEGRVPLTPAGQRRPSAGFAGALPDANVLDDLEPASAPPPPAPAPRSLLERLAISREHRPWLIVGAAVCLLLGLLPPISEPARRRAPSTL